MSYPFPNPSYNPQRPYVGQGQPPPPQASASPYYASYQPPPPTPPQYGPSFPPAAHPPQQPTFPPHHAHAYQQTPQPCYNCGATTHWAQYCPEPRRAVPAGSLSQAHDNRPYKRQKINPPVVTRYTVPPPNVNPQYPPHSQRQPHPGQYGPPPQPQAYWPQGRYPPAPQSHSYGPYRSQGHHTPVSPYGPPLGPPGPPQPHASPPNYRPPQMHHQYPAEPRRSSYPDPIQRYPSRQGSPHRWSQPTSFQPTNQHREQPSQWTSFYHDRAPKAANPVAASVSPSINIDQHETYNDDPDDLQSLDFATEQLPRDLDLPVRVGRPILADPTAADAFGPLLAVLSEGKYSVSKYFTNENIAEMEKSIKDTPYWPEFREDPVFREISNSGNVISSSELQDGDVQSDRLDRGDKDSELGNETRNRALSQKGHQEIEVTRSLDSADKDYFSRMSTSPSLDMRPSSERGSTEETLARLGVTGAPKPVVKTALVSRPDRPIQYRSSFHGNSHPEQHYELSNPGRSKESGNAIQLSSRATWSERGNDGYSDDLTSQNSPEGNHHASSDVASDTNGRYDHSSHRRSASPHVPLEEQRSERTRDYRQRRESEGKKGEPRRQIDDVTPRFRRRQPKVAEAYSRRW